MGKKGNGWIKLYRSVMDNEFYMVKPFSKGQAWIDLLLLAEHETHKKMWRGNMVEFKRGDVCLSIKALAERWGWSRKKARHFLEQLEGMEMVHLNAHQSRTTITIVKWASFQDKGTTDGTPKGTSKDTTDGTLKDTTEGTYLKNTKKNKRIKEAAQPTSDELVAAEEDDEEPPVPGAVRLPGGGWDYRPEVKFDDELEEDAT